MADDDIGDETPPRGSKKSLIIGVVLALVGAGAGYFATSSGFSSAGDGHQTADAHGATSDHKTDDSPKEATVFLPIDPVVVNLPLGSAHDHFRLVFQLEVTEGAQSEIAHQMPRILDVTNRYLRAIDPEDLEERVALARLRNHLLARFATMLETDQIRDLLIIEFVLS